MKKLILLLALLAVLVSGCYEQNPSGEEQFYLVIKANGDTLNIKALNWQWDGTKNVLFHSHKGSQYVNDVKDIIIKE